MLDFRLSLERALSLAVDPTCLLAQLTILTLRASQKGMKALLGGGAAEELPKMGRQPVASPARMVRPHGHPCIVQGLEYILQQSLQKRITLYCTMQYRSCVIHLALTMSCALYCCFNICTALLH